jgi:hypothetical protein
MACLFKNKSNLILGFDIIEREGEKNGMGMG